jgi:phosphatidylserine/phosphatidylglycerophosphate/cardiolipin synthase-like enzyme
VNLLIQPEAGIAQLLSAIRSAKKSIDIAIFRFDRAEMEAALKAAVARGVAVRALIAYTNRGGEIHLRKLEMHLLEAGVTVSRTASDLLRYHNKVLIIDRRVLYVLSFNFTHLDIDHSRGFGIVTRNAGSVQEALKLFEADATRQPYTPKLNSFVVSPANAREVLAGLLRKARKQILIYDPQISDPQMLRVLKERKNAGVEIKVIGCVKGPNTGLEVHELADLRLHTRTIICDRRRAFVGSQSLRRIELDLRREVGIIVHESKVVNALIQTFEADWVREAGDEEHARPKLPKRAVKSLVKELSPLHPVVQEAVEQAEAEKNGDSLNRDEIKATVKEAVQEVVQERVEAIVKESLEEV